MLLNTTLDSSLEDICQIYSSGTNHYRRYIPGHRLLAELQRQTKEFGWNLLPHQHLHSEVQMQCARDELET